MTAPRRMNSEILRDAERHLEYCRQALGDMGNRVMRPGEWRQLLDATRHIVVWGRSVTATIQNLRTPVGAERFDAWWQPWSQRFRDDPGFLYLWDLRNQVDKEGDVGQSMTVMLPPEKPGGPIFKGTFLYQKTTSQHRTYPAEPLETLLPRYLDALTECLEEARAQFE